MDGNLSSTSLKIILNYAKFWKLKRLLLENGGFYHKKVKAEANKFFTNVYQVGELAKVMVPGFGTSVDQFLVDQLLVDQLPVDL